MMSRSGDGGGGERAARCLLAFCQRVRAHKRALLLCVARLYVARQQQANNQQKNTRVTDYRSNKEIFYLSSKECAFANALDIFMHINIHRKRERRQGNCDPSEKARAF